MRQSKVQAQFHPDEGGKVIEQIVAKPPDAGKLREHSARVSQGGTGKTSATDPNNSRLGPDEEAALLMPLGWHLHIDWHLQLFPHEARISDRWMNQG